MFDFRAERVIASVDQSLERLGLEYLDIIQVHDPEFSPNLDVVINETLPALEECRKAGKIRYIGVTGYPLEVLPSTSKPYCVVLCRCLKSFSLL